MKKNNKREIFNALSMITQIGISMLVPIVGCMLLGIFLDRKFETKVVFLIIFTILGVGASFRTFYMMTVYNYRKKDTKK